MWEWGISLKLCRVNSKELEQGLMTLDPVLCQGERVRQSLWLKELLRGLLGSTKTAKTVWCRGMALGATQDQKSLGEEVGRWLMSNVAFKLSNANVRGQRLRLPFWAVYILRILHLPISAFTFSIEKMLAHAIEKQLWPEGTHPGPKGLQRWDFLVLL
jgi:hypothetical protein